MADLVLRKKYQSLPSILEQKLKNSSMDALNSEKKKSKMFMSREKTGFCKEIIDDAILEQTLSFNRNSKSFDIPDDDIFVRDSTAIDKIQEKIVLAKETKLPGSIFLKSSENTQRQASSKYRDDNSGIQTQILLQDKIPEEETFPQSSISDFSEEYKDFSHFNYYNDNSEYKLASLVDNIGKVAKEMILAGDYIKPPICPEMSPFALNRLPIRHKPPNPLFFRSVVQKSTPVVQKQVSLNFTSDSNSKF